MTREHFLENRIPPPLVGAMTGVLMVGVDRATPALRHPFPGALAVAAVVAILGFGMAAAGIVAFRRHQTTVNPLKPDTASSLVETGIYRRTRNPMYFGLTLALLALGIWRAHPFALLLVPAFPLYIGRFQIPPEERAMRDLFGTAYDEYRARVPRWW